MNQPQQGYGPPYPPPGWRPIPPPPLSPAGQPLADFGTRLLAYPIDAAVISSDKPYQQTLHDKFAQTVVIKVSA